MNRVAPNTRVRLPARRDAEVSTPGAPGLRSLRFPLSPRPGFTLIESVVVMASLSIVILLIAATLWGAVKIERADAATLQRIIVQAALADRFREDVGHAVECPDSLNEIQSGPACLILKLADRHVVYRWSDDRLKRTEFAGDQSAAAPLAVGGEQVSVRFDRSADGHTATLHLVESRGRRESRRDWPLEISAAVGGDRR